MNIQSLSGLAKLSQINRCGRFVVFIYAQATQVRATDQTGSRAQKMHLPLALKMSNGECAMWLINLQLDDLLPVLIFAVALAGLAKLAYGGQRC